MAINLQPRMLCIVTIFLLNAVWLPFAGTAYAVSPAQVPTPTANVHLQAQAKALTDEGIALYQNQQDIQGALQKFAKALQLYREANDQAGEAKLLYNIGLIYSYSAEY